LPARSPPEGLGLSTFAEEDTVTPDWC